ncbi:MAG: hypothetical protein JWN82_557 [Candidatus Saccharibacteria bacterium]|nr:hypothetical protein [Candidatus Saccharibacteria bacterium]
MTTVSLEASLNVPAAERRQRLVDSAAASIVDNCTTIPEAIKPEMLGFAAGTVGFILDAARRQRMIAENVDQRVASRLLFKTDANSPRDRAAIGVLAMFANRATPEVITEGEDGSANKAVRSFPLEMEVSGRVVTTEVLRLEYADTHSVKYIIQEEI